MTSEKKLTDAMKQWRIDREKKYNAVSSMVGPMRHNTQSYVVNGVAATLFANLVFFAMGSAAWSLRNSVATGADGTTAVTPGLTNKIYGDTSYAQAVKNAYMFDSVSDGRGGMFQALCGTIAVLFSICAGVGIARTSKQIAQMIHDDKIRAMIDDVDKLAMPGLSRDAIAHIVACVADYMPHIIANMAAIDRKYMDNLAAGGLNDADFQVASAIVAGHLKTHPADYQKIISIIDSATLPAHLMSDGKNTLSFVAARAMGRVR